MHSRSPLHRLSEAPRASAAEVDHDERHPLGFADVRATEPAPAGDTRARDRPRHRAGASVRHRMSFRRTQTPAARTRRRGAVARTRGRIAVDAPGLTEMHCPDVGHARRLGGRWAVCRPVRRRAVLQARDLASPPQARRGRGRGACRVRRVARRRRRGGGLRWTKPHEADRLRVADRRGTDAEEEEAIELVPAEEVVVSEPVAAVEQPEEEPVSSPEPVIADAGRAERSRHDEPGETVDVTIDEAELTTTPDSRSTTR